MTEQKIQNKRIKQLEAKSDHDTAALVESLSEKCSKNARPWIHYGLTSNDLVDTSNSMQMRDALQIIEQILPFFQPSFNLTVDLISSIGEKRDIPIVLENISFQDDYEGSFESRRALIYTLSFTAKTYLFGPVAESTEGLIKKVIVDQHSGTNTQTAKREVRYTVTPDPSDAGPNDDFGFSETWTDYGDSKDLSPTRQIDL